MMSQHTLPAVIAMCAAVTFSLDVTAEAPRKGGTLTVALETDARGFDAVKGGVLGASGGTVSNTIHNSLVRYDFDKEELVPELATAWSVSDDKKTVTFTLRKGVKFHDGSDFTAADVADHVNRILDPKNRSASRGFITAMKEVRAPDPHTVVIELHHPWLPVVGMMAGAHMTALIPSHKSVEAGTQNRQPIGTGPFRLSSWAGGDRIVVERNPDYWNKDAIHLDRIVFRILPDTKARFASLKSGEVDVIWTDRGSTITAARKDPDLVTIAREGSGSGLTLLNTSKPPLDDVRVRKAIIHGLDQRLTNKVVWKGSRPFITHPLGPDVKCDAGYPEHDPEKARKLLADYGKPVSFEYQITATPRGRDLGVIAQQLMKKIGVKTNLKAVDQSTYVKHVFTNDYQYAGWRLVNARDIGIQLFGLTYSKSPYNLTRYKDPEIDKVALAMRTASTPEDRVRHMCTLVRKVNEAGTMRFTAGNRDHVFTRKHVRGVSIMHLGSADVRYAWKSQ